MQYFHIQHFPIALWHIELFHGTMLVCNVVRPRLDGDVSDEIIRCSLHCGIVRADQREKCKQGDIVILCPLFLKCIKYLPDRSQSDARRNVLHIYIPPATSYKPIVNPGHAIPWPNNNHHRLLLHPVQIRLRVCDGEISSCNPRIDASPPYDRVTFDQSGADYYYIVLCNIHSTKALSMQSIPNYGWPIKMMDSWTEWSTGGGYVRKW